jgi:hypothetical protein
MWTMQQDHRWRCLDRKVWMSTACFFVVSSGCSSVTLNNLTVYHYGTATTCVTTLLRPMVTNLWDKRYYYFLRSNDCLHSLHLALLLPPLFAARSAVFAKLPSRNSVMFFWMYWLDLGDQYKFVGGLRLQLYHSILLYFLLRRLPLPRAPTATSTIATTCSGDIWPMMRLNFNNFRSSE